MFVYMGSPPAYLVKYGIRFGIIFAIALIIGSGYPRHTSVRQAWGLPFEYRFQIRQEYIIQGQEEKAKGFNLSVLLTDVWIIAFAMTFGLFAAGTIYALLKRLMSTHLKY